MGSNGFKPALIIVDLQEDFCPPVSAKIKRSHDPTQPNPALSIPDRPFLTQRQTGALAVPNGRTVIPTINALLSLPFVLKIATKDWHPSDHISFASQHANKAPYADTTTIINPSNADETYETRLWPDHCVQDTPGAELVPELHVDRVDRVLEKGMHRDVEMYSAFYAPLERPRVCDSGLVGVLKNAGVTDVYVVGLAADYCVRATAVDASREGFKTCIVEEGTRPVDEVQWVGMQGELKELGVSIVSFSSEEVARVGRL